MIRVLLTLYICLTLHTLASAQNASPVTDSPFQIETLSNLNTDEAIPNAQIISTRALPFQNKNPQKPIKELSIFPNPSFGPVSIELTFETLELVLFDMLGHNLGTVPFQQLEDELVSIDLSQLPAGAYALQLKHEEGTDIQKIVILND